MGTRNWMRWMCGMAAGAALLAVTASVPALAMEEPESACPGPISTNYFTVCVDGYEWLMKLEYGPNCRASRVPVAQKFQILSTRNGKPRMTIPVPCDE